MPAPQFRPGLRSAASASTLSCARRVSQNAPNSARKRAMALRLARLSLRVPDRRTLGVHL